MKKSSNPADTKPEAESAPPSRPLRHSVSAWFTLVLIVCLTTAWWDSNRHQICASASTGYDTVHAVHAHAGFKLQFGGTPPAAGPRSAAANPAKPEIALPRLQLSNPSGERSVYLPHWFMIGLWLGACVCWRGLRSRRKRFRIAVFLGAPSLLLFFLVWTDSAANWMMVSRSDGRSRCDVWSLRGALRLEYVMPSKPERPCFDLARQEAGDIGLGPYFASEEGVAALFPSWKRTESFDTSDVSVRRIDIAWWALLAADAAFWLLFLMVPVRRPKAAVAGH